jgi:hypothetical protein
MRVAAVTEFPVRSRFATSIRHTRGDVTDARWDTVESTPLARVLGSYIADHEVHAGERKADPLR